MKEDKSSIKSKTFSGFFWMFGERITAQLVSFIVSIVLSRILIPEHFGIIALCNVFISLCNVFVNSGFGQSLVQKKDADELDFSSTLYSTVVISIVLYLVLFFVAPFIAQFYDKYDNQLLTTMIRIMALRLPLAAYNSIQHAYVSKKMLFRKFFFSTLFGTVISGVVGIILAYNGFGVYALVAQYLTNVFIDTIVLTITLKWLPKWKYSFKRFISLFKYGWKLLLSGLLDTGYNELRSLVIGKKYSTSDLAFYDKGKQLPSIIGVNTNSAISSVLFPAMSKMQDDIEKVKYATQQSIRISSYLIFPMLVGLAAVAEPLIQILFTEKWLECVPYLQVLCIVYAFYPMHIANLQAIKAIGKSGVYLILEIIKKVIGITILLVTMRFGVFWIAVGAAIGTLLGSFINAFPNKKLLNYKFSEQIKDILPNMLIALFMGACVYMFNFLNINIYLKLVVQVLSGIVIYFGLSLLFRNKSFYYVKNILKEIIQSMHKLRSKEENS